MINTSFFKQTDLLVQVIPFVNTEACFALKGGTAINFFARKLSLTRSTLSRFERELLRRWYPADFVHFLN